MTKGRSVMTHAERSAKAREGRLRYLAEKKEIDQAIKKDNERALVYIELCRLISKARPELTPEMIGVRYFPGGKNYHIGHEAKPIMMGFACGVAFADSEKITREDKLAVFKLTSRLFQSKTEERERTGAPA